MVKAISEVEGVLPQTTPEIDTSSINQGSLHLIVRDWTLQEQAQVRRAKALVVVAIKVACVRADIKIVGVAQFEDDYCGE